MQDNNQNDIVTNADILEFLKEHMVMREDIKDMVAKEDIKDMATNTGLKGMEEKMMTRFSELQSELEDIKLRLDKIEKTLKDNTDALASEVMQLKKRVAHLEQQLGAQRATFMAQP